MTYALLVGDDEPGSPSNEDLMADPVLQSWRADLEERGTHLAGARLSPVRSATAVQLRDGETLAADGPFADWDRFPLLWPCVLHTADVMFDVLRDALRREYRQGPRPGRLGWCHISGGSRVSVSNRAEGGTWPMDESQMNESRWLAARFEEHRGELRAVAYRMLGSLAEADDAVQEAWLRLARSDVSEVDNLGAWLTTVVGRVCLNMLRSRATRREDPLASGLPAPVITRPEDSDPEQQAVLADSVGLALLVVLDALPPAERVAFVLHDMFAVPYDQIAPIVGRSTTAARQLASRARHRVQGSSLPDRDVARQRRVVDAFFAAARDGDFDALVAVLDPDVVLRADGGAQPGASSVIRGAAAVARQALMFAGPDRRTQPVLVNGAAGVLVTVDGEPVSVMGFAVTAGRITAIDAITDAGRLRRLDLTGLV